MRSPKDELGGYERGRKVDIITGAHLNVKARLPLKYLSDWLIGV